VRNPIVDGCYFRAGSDTEVFKSPAGRAKKVFVQQLEAMLLACPKCRRAVRVRKWLLLILPAGAKYECICSRYASRVHKETAVEVTSGATIVESIATEESAVRAGADAP
jgi:hypothetical protein